MELLGIFFDFCPETFLLFEINACTFLHVLYVQIHLDLNHFNSLSKHGVQILFNIIQNLSVVGVQIDKFQDKLLYLLLLFLLISLIGLFVFVLTLFIISLINRFLPQIKFDIDFINHLLVDLLYGFEQRSIRWVIFIHKLFLYSCVKFVFDRFELIYMRGRQNNFQVFHYHVLNLDWNIAFGIVF